VERVVSDATKSLPLRLEGKPVKGPPPKKPRYLPQWAMDRSAAKTGVERWAAWLTSGGWVRAEHTRLKASQGPEGGKGNPGRQERKKTVLARWTDPTVISPG